MTTSHKQRNKELIAYYKNRHSMRETARCFGLSLERVRQLLRREAPELIRPPGNNNYYKK